MTEEKRKYLIDKLTTEIDEDDESFSYFEWDLDRINNHNELIKHPEYIYAVNIAVDLLDQVGNIGQARDVVQLLPDVLESVLRLLNV